MYSRIKKEDHATIGYDEKNYFEMINKYFAYYTINISKLLKIILFIKISLTFFTLSYECRFENFDSLHFFCFLHFLRV